MCFVNLVLHISFILSSQLSNLFEVLDVTSLSELHS